MKYKTTKKIRNIIDKLKKKHLIFIFNHLYKTTSQQEQHQFVTILLSYDFKCYVPYVSIELLSTTFLVLGRFRNR